MNRLCLCTFYEKNGILKDYVLYYLKGLLEISSKLVVIVNGQITQQSKDQLEALDIEIVIRENIGLDFGAWKEYLKINRTILSDYNQLILTNTTCYGPIYSLLGMFEEMESRDCDFWGVTKHKKLDKLLIPNEHNTQIFEHIQSYFLVFNKNLFLSDDFMNFWNNVEFYEDYNKVVGYYETKLTNYFENLGYKSDSYIPLNFHEHITDNPMFYTDGILENYKLPLVKRKAITLFDYNFIITKNLGNQGQKILNFIKEKTNYPISFIYNDLLTEYPMSIIKKNLNLNYILSSYSSKSSVNNKKIATIVYIYYKDLIDYCFKYLNSLPSGTDIYIVSSNKEVLEECKNQSYKLSKYNLIYRLKNNRGRDVSAYLVTCADVFVNYDYICCIHDKKSKHEDGLYGINFMEHCFDNLLKSKQYVENILEIFEKNIQTGLLCPPTPNFGCLYNFVIANELATNEYILQSLYETLSLKVPFDKNPYAPFGSMFWIKADAIKPLFRKKWTIEDFPDEPLPIDGTISHAIERLYPSIVQEAGYLSGWVMTNEYASLYIENLMCNLMDIKLSQQLNYSNINYKLIEKLFSIKNTKDQKYKIVCILGIKFKFKKRKK